MTNGIYRPPGYTGVWGCGGCGGVRGEAGWVGGVRAGRAVWVPLARPRFRDFNPLGVRKTPKGVNVPKLRIWNEAGSG